MKKILSVLGIVSGAVLILTATSKDDMLGSAYGIGEMFVTAILGAMLLLVGTFALVWKGEE